MEDNRQDDLVIDYGHGKASIAISPSKTLSDVRKMMLEEFDDDMFPQQDSQKWVFWVNDMRISSKQEGRKIAWNYLTANLNIRGTDAADARRTAGLSVATASDAIAASVAEDVASAKPSVNDVVTEEAEIDTKIGTDIMDFSDEDCDIDSVEEISALPELLLETPDDRQAQAFEKTKTNLQILRMLLEETEHSKRVFAETTRQKLNLEVKTLLKSKRPETIIGVYGSTGVGKSSLLNALLDEASVLPTSGSQGCTATVVELLFNSSLLEPPTQASKEDCAADQYKQQVPVYRGEVEFMKNEEWEAELRILVQECCTDKGRLYIKRPSGKEMPATAAAWTKINHVYGGGTLEKCFDKRIKGGDLKVDSDKDSDDEDFTKEVTETWTAERVFRYLCSDERVKDLLDPSGPGAQCNVIKIEEGLVEPGSDDAKALLKPYVESNESVRLLKEHWATSFREKIDSYVYKHGKESDAQTWPLIRKVCLFGPWHVLSTGACLVDLPGVKDANAARAKVAETYLENCSNIWIVAPIKRAVDDGTAKELMGDQFKRRILMDGQYGSLSFICTSTDKVEASETMRDHADIAKLVPGRWEKMVELAEESGRLGNKDGEEAMLKRVLQSSTKSYKAAKKAFLDSKDHAEREQLKSVLNRAKSKKKDAESKLEICRAEKMHAEQHRKKLQNQLKVLCAQVRNDYSKGRLQDDFRAGLKDMYTKDADHGGLGDEANVGAQEGFAIPDSFEMDVFCTSANDYMKATGVKSSCDGPPETFFDPNDTQIPLLRSFVHDTTNNHCKIFVRHLVESTEHLLSKVELFASCSKYVASSEETALALKQTFDTEIANIQSKATAISKIFESEMESSIAKNLLPALSDGANKSKEAAMKTIDSWGTYPYRTKMRRDPGQNGMAWSTYQACIRRYGEYTSKSAGAIDLNQELYDPMEKAFATDWQRIMDASMRRLLLHAKQDVQNVCDKLISELVHSFTRAGFEKTSLDVLILTATRACSTALSAAFDRMNKASTRLQRQLSRSILPKIKKKMIPSYVAAQMVPCGTGKFQRMKNAMHHTSKQTLETMFSENVLHMQTQVSAAIKTVSESIEATASLLKENLESFLSLSWDLDRAKASPVDETVLSTISQLSRVQSEACQLLDSAGETLDDAPSQSPEVPTFEEKEAANDSNPSFEVCKSFAASHQVPTARNEGVTTKKAKVMGNTLTLEKFADGST